MLILLDALDPKAPPAGVDPYAWISYVGIIGMFASLMAIYWYTVRMGRKREEGLLETIKEQSKEQRKTNDRVIESEKETAKTLGEASATMAATNRLLERTASALEGAAKEMDAMRSLIIRNGRQ